MKTIFLGFLLIVSIVYGKIPQHLDDLRMLQKKTPVAETSYRHGKSLVLWKSAQYPKYICRTDCSGLLNELIKHSYHYSKKDLANWLEAERPLAKNYYTAINEEKNFSKINRIMNIKPGDIIAIQYTVEAPSKGHDTGHVMVVNKKPKMINFDEIRQKIRWDIEVIDSSHGHGKADSRYFGKKFHSGIGKGIFVMYTDFDGNISGFTWSNSLNSIYFGEDKRPLLVGRLKI